MARKRTGESTSEPKINPSLILPRSQAEEKLRERIAKGREIQNSNISAASQIEDLRDQQQKWHDYNVELLSRCFDTDEISKAHANVYGYGVIVMNASPQQRHQSFKEGIGKQITSLESILDRLELIPEKPPEVAAEKSPGSLDNITIINTKRVFVVHGHDDLVKSSVARFIEKMGLEAIILHEQPNNGKTIIEKFEANAAGVSFAVVLLTPDDVAAPASNPDHLRHRARQNVVLELGYFCGALGRNRVCVLYKGDVEIPSDYLGVIYTPLDDAEGWHLKLAKEMKVAGLDIDLNKAIG